jgi:RimJ/RimL family protein N-acetyltransferase
MKQVFLTGNGIYLRPIERSDVGQNYLNWINDSAVTRGMASGYFPTSLAQLEAYVNSVLTDEHTLFFALCLEENNRHIGNVKVDRIDWIAGTCELGIIIGEEDARGRGYGKEAMKVLIQYIFQDLNLRKISLAVFENNTAAKHLYESLGFIEEGRFVKHVFKEGKLWDKFYLALFNPNQKI